MPIAFVVLVRDPKQQTFSWCPAMADTPVDAMGVVGQALANSGREDCMLVGAFTEAQVMSAKPLFEQMEEIMQRNKAKA